MLNRCFLISLMILILTSCSLTNTSTEKPNDLLQETGVWENMPVDKLLENYGKPQKIRDITEGEYKGGKYYIYWDGEVIVVKDGIVKKIFLFNEMI